MPQHGVHLFQFPYPLQELGVGGFLFGREELMQGEVEETDDDGYAFQRAEDGNEVLFLELLQMIDSLIPLCLAIG